MEKLQIEITDETAIQILNRFSEPERGQIAAKYIILGDTVINYAQLTTNQQNIQDHFTPITDKMVNHVNSTMTAAFHQFELVRKELEGKIPQTVGAELGKLAQPLAQLNNVTQLLNQLHETLSQTISTVAKPAKKGAFSCEIIFQSLKDTFSEDQFEDVSATKARFTDIVAIPSSSKQPIYIEVKDYAKSVPSEEVQKFWRDLEVRQATIGCFISLKTAITNVTTDFRIQNNGSKMGVFVVSETMSGQGHLWAYQTARKILEVMIPPTVDTGQSEKTEWIANLLNNRLQELKRHLQDFEKIQNDLEKSKDTIEKSLSSVTKKVTELRTKLQSTIDMTLQDFPQEVK
jgi:restriction endonuclease Mrr